MSRFKLFIIGRKECKVIILFYMVFCDIFQVKFLYFNRLTNFILKHTTLNYNHYTVLKFFDKTRQDYLRFRKLIYDFIVKNPYYFMGFIVYFVNRYIIIYRWLFFTQSCKILFYSGLQVIEPSFWDTS